MLRLARVMAIAAASGVFLVTPPLAAKAAVPTSICVPATTGYPVDCVLYESAAGAPSEVSDVVSTQLVVPAGIAVLLQNPNGSQTDPKNWSDVVKFIPQAAGSPQSLSVQFLSEGCGNLQDPFDISCFPAPTSVSQFVVEVQTGTGDDFRDCTSFPVVFQGQNAVIVHACSDSPAVEIGDTLPIPEVPLPILLPTVAVGLVAVTGLRRLRRRSA